MSDPRPVHVRLALIAGAYRFITVCPPDPEVRDERVWPFRKASLTNFADNDNNTFDRAVKSMEG